MLPTLAPRGGKTSSAPGSMGLPPVGVNGAHDAFWGMAPAPSPLVTHQRPLFARGGVARSTSLLGGMVGGSATANMHAGAGLPQQRLLLRPYESTDLTNGAAGPDSAPSPLPFLSQLPADSLAFSSTATGYPQAIGGAGRLGSTVFPMVPGDVDPLVDALALDYLDPSSPCACPGIGNGTPGNGNSDDPHMHQHQAGVHAQHTHSHMQLLMRPRKAAKIHSGHLHVTSGLHFHDDACTGTQCNPQAVFGCETPTIPSLPSLQFANTISVPTGTDSSTAAHASVPVVPPLAGQTASCWPPEWASSALSLGGIAASGVPVNGNGFVLPGSSVRLQESQASNEQIAEVFSNVIDLSYPHANSLEEEECQHCLELEREGFASDACGGATGDIDGATESANNINNPSKSARPAAANGVARSNSEGVGAAVVVVDETLATPAVAADNNRRIGQRGKPAITSVIARTPGQYVYGNGDNLFIDVKREDGTVATISLRSSPTRCKTDLIEALNLIPENVLVENWRYFSIILAKVDQSKPFKHLASASLFTTAKRLREMNPTVNLPPAKFVQLHSEPLPSNLSPHTANGSSSSSSRSPSIATPTSQPENNEASGVVAASASTNSGSPVKPSHGTVTSGDRSSRPLPNGPREPTRQILPAKRKVLSQGDSSTGEPPSDTQVSSVASQSDFPSSAAPPPLPASDPNLTMLLSQLLRQVRAQDTLIRQLAGLHRDTLLEVRGLRDEVRQMRSQMVETPAPTPPLSAQARRAGARTASAGQAADAAKENARALPPSSSKNNSNARNNS